MPSSKPHVVLYIPGDTKTVPDEMDVGPCCIVVAGCKLEKQFSAFDAIVVFVGDLRSVIRNSIDTHPQSHANECDSSRRVLEYHEAMKNGKSIIFLVPKVEFGDVRTVLFAEAMNHLGVCPTPMSVPLPTYGYLAPEFEQFRRTYGTAATRFDISRTTNAKILAQEDRDTLSFTAQNVFCLPCIPPLSLTDLNCMAVAAFRGVAEYRRNHDNEIPAWVDQIPIGNELSLRNDANAARDQLSDIEARLECYRQEKAILSTRGDPLVDHVQSILENRFQLNVRRKDVCIEDLALVDESGEVIAIVEVKGVNSNFKREHINQVDSHRERLELPIAVPGLLIMNTFASAADLGEKLEEVHPDIVAKAADDNVVLLRTIDLLYAIDLLEKHFLLSTDFKAALLSRAGWLRVIDEKLVWKP